MGVLVQKKVLFFDIDNTILTRQNEIPESTFRAFEKLHEKGHLLFLNTGRSRAYVQDPVLLSLGFDGFVTGCGTMIEYREQIIKDSQLTIELVEHTVNTVRKYGIRPILEGKESLYFDESEFGEDPYGMKLKRELGERRLTIEQEWGRWNVYKFACDTTGADRDSCFKELEEHYDFMIHNERVVEIVPKGCHKGVGILDICKYLDVDVKDTYAFGDSANDIGMLDTAGTAVVMGNGSEEAKAHADYVTTDLLDDGIWNACKHLGLI